MSRIGKAPVTLPKGVDINVSKGNLVTVKGPKGELSQQVDPDLTIKTEDGEIVIDRPTEQKRHRAMHGLYRSLLQNLVDGVSEGYVKELELVGVGFRAANTGQMLELTIGYSHPIFLCCPTK